MQLIRQQAERINEMTSVMYKAVNLDENGETRKEEELYQRLITENKVISIYYRILTCTTFFHTFTITVFILRSVICEISIYLSI